jgi:hypothetical protein
MLFLKSISAMEYSLQSVVFKSMETKYGTVYATISTTSQDIWETGIFWEAFFMLILFGTLKKKSLS